MSGIEPEYCGFAGHVRRQTITSMYSGPGGNRTRGLSGANRVLSLAELQAHDVVPERLTPQAHPDLSPWCFSQLLGRRYAPEQLHLSPRYNKTLPPAWPLSGTRSDPVMTVVRHASIQARSKRCRRDSNPHPLP